MQHHGRLAGVVLMLLSSTGLCPAVSITQHHNDINGTGVNSQETILTPANVIGTDKGGHFGKLYSLPVDGQVYAQPLYLQGVNIPGYVGARNVLYVATENNSVYAFDADSSTPIVYWQKTLGIPILCTQIPGCAYDLVPAIGITGTPVIDIARNAIDVVTSTYTMGNAGFSLHSLNLTTGAERIGSPVVISGQVAGTSYDGNGSVVTFTPIKQLQRPGLLLLNGDVYIAFGSHSDIPPYHGWIFGYDGSSLRRLVIKCVSPNEGWSAIWQGGEALRADSSGNIYAVTGNGELTAPTGPDYGDSVLKMNSLSALAVTGFFSPSNQFDLYEDDKDLGAGGVIVIPGSIAANPLLIAGGKDGRIFLLNSASLGGFGCTNEYADCSSADNVLQEIQATQQNFGGEVFFNNNLYTWGAGDFLKMWCFTNSQLSLSPVSTNNSVLPAFGYPNAPAMSISANGLNNGILWATWSSTGPANGYAYPGTLHAFDASNLSTELWNSDQTGGADYSGSWAKWCPPTIANGKVYLATFDGAITVFGLTQ
jgi:hypothetical protein